MPENLTSLKITRIEKQKNNKSRYSVFVNDEYAFSIAAELLAKTDLRQGQEISAEEIEQIKAEDERYRGKIQAFHYLARRDHSERELYDKLRRKGFSNQTIQWVLSNLKQQNFLNDARFARLYARNRLLQHPSGRRQLAFELERKGISKEVVDDTVANLYTEFDELEVARTLAKKKVSGSVGLPVNKRRKRLADFLIRRGFEWEVVNQILTELFDDRQATIE